MSKATIEYDLENPEDEMALKRAMASTKMAIAIFELKHNLRKKVNWHVENNIEEHNKEAKYQTMEYILDQVMEELEDINIDEII